MPDEQVTQFDRLRKHFSGPIFQDTAHKVLYSTDASLYQIEPIGVAFPRNEADVLAAVQFCAEQSIPILARGAGSSLAGQAIGRALILDCSRYMNTISWVDPDRKLARLQPGVIVRDLNRAAKPYGLQFGPDPASLDRATIGGSIANNATGAHSITYGMCADHLIAAQVVLGRGELRTISNFSVDEVIGRSEQGDYAYSQLSEVALAISRQDTDLIRDRWPKVWRRASGYNLNYLIGYSPGAPQNWDADTWGAYPGGWQAGLLPLAALYAGSEGTLGVLTSLDVRLVRLPSVTLLGLLRFPDISSACASVAELLALQPSAIELIPGSMIDLAKTVPAYAHQLDFLDQDMPALLVVEFAGDDLDLLASQAKQLGNSALILTDPAMQKKVWDVRKVGLGLLNAKPGAIKPVTIIEDLAVPVEHLAEFVRRMEALFDEFGVEGEFYAHASAGCLHIRPLMNIKSERGREDLRAIAERAVQIALSLGGAPSGEHGDGLARSEWMEQTFGTEILQRFHMIKQAADPAGIFNPGKILNAPRMDDNLRATLDRTPSVWQTTLDFAEHGGVLGAVEMCNGAGVCRKDTEVMCPSFQATTDEMHSTRGRANLLRWLIIDGHTDGEDAERITAQALDLCLACKGCKAECPSAVDMAKLKYTFLERKYRSQRRPVRDLIFGNFDQLAKLGVPVSGILRWITSQKRVKSGVERGIGISAARNMPVPVTPVRWPQNHPQPDILVLRDSFHAFLHPEVESAILRIVRKCGVRLATLPGFGAGRTFISKGMLRQAKQRLEKIGEAIVSIDPEGRLPIVGWEPSEVQTLRDEALDFFPGSDLWRAIARRSYSLEEWLIRPDKNGQTYASGLFEVPSNAADNVLLHGHCYQKAQTAHADPFDSGVVATITALKLAGYQVVQIDSGCCGMAGSFGYEAEHYDISMAIGELKLFPAVRRAESGVRIAAAGTSCRTQIFDGTQRDATHPAVLLAERLRRQDH